MTGAERQSRYAKARQRDMTEVAHALRTALHSKTERKAFIATYWKDPGLFVSKSFK
jgi:hypothetical protein